MEKLRYSALCHVCNERILWSYLRNNAGYMPLAIPGPLDGYAQIEGASLVSCKRHPLLDNMEGASDPLE
ncbi:hypothetical protein D3C78_1519290 [compost metagenome]